MATDLCLSITKYSHATGVRADNTIPWTHLQAHDIFVIVKGVDTRCPDGRLNPDGKLDLRIVHGNKVLESVDIAKFVDAAVDARRGAEQVGVTPQIEQLPIFGITKESLLAIRYRLGDGQARRLQLRMQNATECRQVVSVFERRGMEFQEQRPHTARPGTGRSTTAAGQDRLLTAQSSSRYFEPSKSTARPSPFVPQALEAGSLSRRTPASPERSPIGVSEQPAPHAQEMAPPPFFRRDEMVAPREVMPTQPTAAQVYRSYTTPSQPSQYELNEVPRRPSDPTGERPASTSDVAMLGAIREAVENATPPRTAGDMPPSNLRPLHSSEHWSSATDPTNAALLSSNPAEPRPQTAISSTSATTALPNTQEFEIPPRRELPFKRPESRQSGSGSGSRPGTAAKAMPPLPKPKLVKEGSGTPIRTDSASPTKEMLSSRPSTASPLKRTFNALDEEAARPQTAAASSPIKRSAAPRDRSPIRPLSPANTAASPENTARKPTRMDELLYGRKPLAERSTNTKVPRLDSLADAPHETVSPPTSPAKNVAGGQHGPTTNAYASIRSQMHDSNEVSIEEYATQSLQDRQAALDEFMVQNLENPAFTKLCEDVENCWRRIALGL